MPNRMIAIVAALCLVATTALADERPFENGLLWEISRADTPVSHIFGTMHAADPHLHELPAAVGRAFDRATTLVLELHQDQAAAEQFAQACRHVGGPRLSDLLPPSLFETLNARLARVDLPADVTDHLRPWAALVLLSTPENANGETVDVALHRRAVESKKRIVALFAIHEVITAFDALPPDSQLALLRHSLERDALRQRDHEACLDAYLRGDLAALDGLSWATGGSQPWHPTHFALFMKRIVHDRSTIMVARLEPLFAEGRIFAAVGALHLYGPLGMLQRLHDAGWSVRAIP